MSGLICCPADELQHLCQNRRTYGVNRAITDAMALAGSWADHIVLEPGTTVVRGAPGVSATAAMALVCAGPTVVHALYEGRPVRLGETVIVQGSGTGRAGRGGLRPTRRGGTRHHHGRSRAATGRGGRRRHR